MSPRLKQFCLTLGLIVPVLAVVIFYGPIFRYFMPGEVPPASGLPPEFSGNRAAYGFALFSMFSMSSLALRKIIGLGFELYESDFLDELDLNLYRLAFLCIMVLVLIGTSPDVALMLVRGEVGSGTIAFFSTIDRILDGVGIVPFLLAIGFVVRAEQLEAHPSTDLEAMIAGERKAARVRAFYEVVPRGDSLRENAKIVGAVLVIALMLALLK